MARIAVLPGDGIGVEIVPQAIKVLNKVAPKYGIELEYSEGLIGGAAIDAEGIALPETTLQLCKESQAVLLGAIGGPKWDTLPAPQRPEVASLLPLRKHLGLYANVRPTVLNPALIGASPLKEELVKGTDMMLKYSFNCSEGAEEIERAVAKVLAEGYRTGDIMEPGKKLVGTEEMGNLVCEKLGE